MIAQLWSALVANAELTGGWPLVISLVCLGVLCFGFLCVEATGAICQEIANRKARKIFEARQRHADTQRWKEQRTHDAKLALRSDRLLHADAQAARRRELIAAVGKR